MLSTLFATLVAATHIITALRLVCYRRRGARIRRGISLLAALLIGTLLCNAVDIIIYRQPVTLWQGSLAILLLILVYRSRGNLAALLRPTP
ncbi:hypothetical protein CNQ84_11715 [Pseudomonas abyssi]|uniref:Phage holin family protein n=1 Tax=Pseudomonas abyssi TaxID=170540 RepID=A0A2A3MGV3_9PSED|nr:phage holin family protein [Pseudomonas abyssi]PBK04013.1 hypothetical protein CNQ84_11715 [Pseudomonas abyssi]